MIKLFMGHTCLIAIYHHKWHLITMHLFPYIEICISNLGLCRDFIISFYCQVWAPSGLSHSLMMVSSPSVFFNSEYKTLEDALLGHNNCLVFSMMNNRITNYICVLLLLWNRGGPQGPQSLKIHCQPGFYQSFLASNHIWKSRWGNHFNTN